MTKPMLAALAAVLLACVPTARAFQITVFQREFNLQSYVPQLGEAFELTDLEPQQRVTLCYPRHHFESASFLRYYLSTDDTQHLDYVPTQLPDQPEDVSCVALQLGNAEGGTAVVQSVMSLPGTQVSMPSTQSQTGSHLVRFYTTLQTISPYPIASQSTRIHFYSREVRGYSRGPLVKLSGGQLTCGPYTDTAPALAPPQMIVHYANQAVFLRVESLQREIQVSHWGRVSVEEKYRVRNDAAPLEAGFSRVDHMASVHMQASPLLGIPAFTAILPPKAQHLYFRDVIGNISTSHIRHSAGKVLLMMKPRYPLMGSWVTEFTLGYSLPLEAAVTQAGGDYTLRFDFAPPLDQTFFADTVTTRVVLPEGSRNLRVLAPPELDLTETDTKTYTYLDTLGRPTKVLTQGRVTKDHAVRVQVSYSFNRLWALQEPLLCSLVILLLFLLSIVYSRTDLTLAKDSAWRRSRDAALQRDTLQQLRAVLTTLPAHFRALESVAASLADGSSEAAGSAAMRCAAATEGAASDLAQLQAVVEALKQESASNTEAVSGLHGLQRRLLRGYEDLVSKLQKRDAWGAGDAGSAAASRATVAELQKESDLLTEAVLLTC